ncbi:MAG: hypothetical protein QXH80_03855 [Candidatus Nanoarchaeia archaeon]
MNALGAFIFLTLSMTLLTDIYIGSFGLLLPFSLSAMYYFSAVYGWKTIFPIAFIVGIIIDIFYGRAFICSPFFTLLAIGVSEFWIAWGNTKSYFMHLFPGALLGLICALQIILVPSCVSGTEFYLVAFSRGILAVLAGSVILPLIIFFLDRLSKYFGFETCLKNKLVKSGKSRIDWK